MPRRPISRTPTLSRRRPRPDVDAAYSRHPGAVGVMDYLARRNLGRQLDEVQAAALWLEVQAQLVLVGRQDTIDEVRAAKRGVLGTLPRGDVLDAVALVLTAGEFRWPSNAEPEGLAQAFVVAVRRGLAARGIAERAPGRLIS